MTLEHWLAFAAASALMLAIPGPTILLVISYALGHDGSPKGRALVRSTVAGVTLGDFTAMTASMLGLGALLAASAALFTVLKWLGALYLIYLGIKLWRADPTGENAEAAGEVRPLKAFAHAYVVTALNPKSIVFFMAFLPQFLVGGAPLLPQIVLFEATFLVLGTLNAALYAVMAARAAASVRKPGLRRIVNRTGGSLLVGAGILSLGLRRASA